MLGPVHVYPWIVFIHGMFADGSGLANSFPARKMNINSGLLVGLCVFVYACMLVYLLWAMWVIPLLNTSSLCVCVCVCLEAWLRAGLEQ